MDVTATVLGALLVWGTLVGLDLVSLPQMMLSRPIVAGSVAGLILGDATFGVAAGMVLELFALESLAIGAARYPDYGAATVGAVLAGAGFPAPERLGLAVLTGLILASVGGWTLSRLRHANAVAVRRRAASLAMGDPVAVRALQLSGLGRDFVRSSVMCLIAIAAGIAVRSASPLPVEAAAGLLLVVLGGGIAGVTSGALKSAGRGNRLRWLGAGAVIGIVIAVVSR